jgi:hypothetical protein
LRVFPVPARPRHSRAGKQKTGDEYNDNAAENRPGI